MTQHRFVRTNSALCRIDHGTDVNESTKKRARDEGENQVLSKISSDNRQQKSKSNSKINLDNANKDTEDTETSMEKEPFKA